MPPTGLTARMPNDPAERRFDFTALDAFVQDVPHEALATLRRECPVYWNPLPRSTVKDDGFWLITRHQDIVAIEKDPQRFSSHEGLTIADAPPANAGPAWLMVRDGLAHLDPPDHGVHRQLIAPSFTVSAIAAIEEKTRAIAADVLERACAQPQCDFATDVALRFPVAAVLGVVLGLPQEDFERGVHWSDVIVAPNDPEFVRSAGVNVVQELHRYALSVARSKRKEPADDVLSVLAHTTTADGQAISDEMFVRFFWSLVTGAFDTTASAISGGMLAFVRFPEQYARLLDAHGLVRTAVEEILRWETPTIYFRRTATADTALHGKRIGRGQRLVMCYAAANRDPDVFSDPDTFDVTRQPNYHLSFGHGPHFCLGANLARMEIRVLFEEIVARRLHVELRGDVRRARSNFQNRIKRMPVSIS